MYQKHLMIDRFARHLWMQVLCVVWIAAIWLCQPMDAHADPRPVDASQAAAVEQPAMNDPRPDDRPEPASSEAAVPVEDPEPADTHGANDDGDDLPAEEREAIEAAVARPVPADPVQLYGWREKIKIQEIDASFHAKLDSGALTSSIHAEEITLFERDGEKWVKFIATDPREKDAKRIPVEAPLIRYARIKEIGGESSRREVVRLNIRIGKRSLRGEFTLVNRANMLVPVLIGRTMLRELGWVDPSRTYIADQEIFR